MVQKNNFIGFLISYFSVFSSRLFLTPTRLLGEVLRRTDQLSHMMSPGSHPEFVQVNFQFFPHFGAIRNTIATNCAGFTEPPDGPPKVDGLVPHRLPRRVCHDSDQKAGKNCGPVSPSMRVRSQPPSSNTHQPPAGNL